MQRPISLTQRDIDLICFLWRVAGAVTQHLRRRYFPGTSRTTVHGRLGRLARSKYLVSQPLPTRTGRGAGEYWWMVGPAALPLLQHYVALTEAEKRQVRHHCPPTHWRHEIDLKDVLISIELACQRSAGLVTLEDTWTERALRRRALKVSDPFSGEVTEVTPDAAVLLHSRAGRSHRLAIELDRGSQMSMQRQLPKLRAQIERGETTLYVAPDDARLSQLSRWAVHAAKQLDVEPSSLWLSTLDRLTEESVLTHAVWRTAMGEPRALIQLLLPNPTKTAHQSQSADGDLTLQ
jgi:hypothetical protein